MDRREDRASARRELRVARSRQSALYTLYQVQVAVPWSTPCQQRGVHSLIEFEACLGFVPHVHARVWVCVWWVVSFYTVSSERVVFGTSKPDDLVACFFGDRDRETKEDVEDEGDCRSTEVVFDRYGKGRCGIGWFGLAG